MRGGEAKGFNWYLRHDQNHCRSKSQGNVSCVYYS